MDGGEGSGVSVDGQGGELEVRLSGQGGKSEVSQWIDSMWS